MGFFAEEDQLLIWRVSDAPQGRWSIPPDVSGDGTPNSAGGLPPAPGTFPSPCQFLPSLRGVVVTTPQPRAQRVAQRARSYVPRR